MTAQRSIIVAHQGAPELLRWLETALGTLGPIRVLAPGEDLERALLSEASTYLVVASTGISIPSAFATLVAARAAGRSFPFVIVAGFREDRIRAIVIAAQAAHFDLRVLSIDELTELATELIRDRIAGTAGTNESPFG